VQVAARWGKLCRQYCDDMLQIHEFYPIIELVNIYKKVIYFQIGLLKQFFKEVDKCYKNS